MITYDIVWSEPAKEEYWQNIDYLLENWTEKQAENFIDAVYRILNLIGNNPKTFALTEYKNIRSALIVKQITLYYRITNNNTIELVHFWNNYQNPDKLMF